MAALPQARPRSGVLTASAATAATRRGGTSGQNSDSTGWQKRALRYISSIPELNYASRFYARMLSPLRLFPATIDGRGKITPIEDETAISILDRIRDPGGGRSQLLGNYGKLMFTTGEGQLFGRDLGTDGETWAFVWNDEVQTERRGDQIVKYLWKPNGDTVEREYTPSQAVAYRFWTSSIARSGSATSPMESALDIAEELVLLTAAVRATAVSRTTNKIVFMPIDALPPNPSPEVADEDPENDPFMSDLVAHLQAQIENIGTAEAVAPFIVWMNGEHIQNVKVESLHDTQNDYAERDLRKEAVERLARGFDFPPEVLLGLGSTNHWAAMQILQDMWKSHGVPIAEQFCHDLNQAYYQPALRDAGVANWQQIMISYDASDIVVKPDRSDDANQAFDREAVGYKGYRQLLHIPEDYAPTPDERRQMREAKSAGRAQRQPQQQDQQQQDPQQGPAAPGAEGDSGRRTRQTASAEFGAAVMALHRCREIAGNKIRNRAKGGLAQYLSGAEGAPADQVAAIVGGSSLRELDLEPRQLVSEGTGGLRSVLSGFGYSPVQIDALCEMVEVFAARTLFDAQVSLPRQAEDRIAQMREMIETLAA